MLKSMVQKNHTYQANHLVNQLTRLYGLTFKVTQKDARVTLVLLSNSKATASFNVPYEVDVLPMADHLLASVLSSLLRACSKKVSARVRAVMVEAVSIIEPQAWPDETSDVIRKSIVIGGCISVYVHRDHHDAIYSTLCNPVLETTQPHGTVDINDVVDTALAYANAIEDQRHANSIMESVADFRALFNTCDVPLNVVEYRVAVCLTGRMNMFWLRITRKALGLAGQRFPLELRLGMSNHPDKGLEGKICNVSACGSNHDVKHYNRAMRAYYCGECANDIDAANFESDIYNRRGDPTCP